MEVIDPPSLPLELRDARLADIITIPKGQRQKQLRTRVINSLRGKNSNRSIETIGELLCFLPDELLEGVPGFGHGCLTFLETSLEPHGLRLGQQKIYDAQLFG